MSGWTQISKTTGFGISYTWATDENNTALIGGGASLGRTIVLVFAGASYRTRSGPVIWSSSNTYSQDLLHNASIAPGVHLIRTAFDWARPMRTLEGPDWPTEVIASEERITVWVAPIDTSPIPATTWTFDSSSGGMGFCTILLTPYDG